MNNETLSVNALALLVGKCSNLDPNFSEKDRTPLTDGHIEVYRDGRRSNSHLDGRVQVQIKGREMKSKPKKSLPKYTLKVETLRAFKKLRTTILFLVSHIYRENGDPAFRHFYATLSPNVIESHLSRLGNSQGTVSLRLSVLPTEEQGLERVVRFALESQRQNPELNPGDFSLDKVTKFSLYSDVLLDLSAGITLNPMDTNFSLVATLTGGSEISLTGIFSIQPQIVEEVVAGLTISSGGATFDSIVRKPRTDGGVELRISDGVSIVHEGPPENGSATLSFGPQQVLSKRIKDLLFVVGASSGCVVSDGVKTGTTTFERPDDGGQLEDQLETLQKLAKVLIVFGADPDFVSLDELNARQVRQLLALYSVVIEGKPQTTITTPSRVSQTIGASTIELMALPEGGDGKVKIQSLFSPIEGHLIYAAAGDANGETVTFPVTPFDLVAGQDLSEILNLPLDRVVPSYMEIGGMPEVENSATMLFFALVRAASKASGKEVEFLTAAEALNEWIISTYGATDNHLLNRWQVAFRLGTLTTSLRRQIRDTRRRAIQGAGRADVLVEAACSILLEDNDEFEQAFRRLDEDQRSMFEGWPIFELSTLCQDSATGQVVPA